jgi:hypothetical protein
MEEAELMVVSDSFQISGRGLVVVPDFAHAAASWKGGSEMATVIRPDGSSIRAKLNLHVAHFNIPDPTAPPERRWRIVPAFPDLGKEDVPVGSRVLASRPVVDALRHGDERPQRRASSSSAP